MPDKNILLFIEKSRQMEESTEEQTEHEVEDILSVRISNEINDLSHLVGTIITYYESKTTFTASELDESEKWKEGTQYEKRSPIVYPNKVDEFVQKAFVSQLKKFIQSDKPNAQ